MSRKNDYNYFDGFIKLSKFSLNSAELLHKTLSNFNANEIAEKVKEMHQIEHTADLAKHEIMDHLVKEFLPPIEREDITNLSQEIDDVIDSVEDVLLFINMFNIKTIKPEVLQFIKLIERCCKCMDEALVEFKNFRNNKKLHEKIIEINHLEEEGDGLYVDMICNLYRTSTDPIELMTWTEIMHRLEICCDNCEDVADIIEGIVMKNS
ncbi:MAG TPA: DUF47 family protein [Mobilitalea sp.]|nr:DUF47 family protein [Mobilitalea sp.]